MTVESERPPFINTPYKITQKKILIFRFDDKKRLLFYFIFILFYEKIAGSIFHFHFDAVRVGLIGKTRITKYTQK